MDCILRQTRWRKKKLTSVTGSTEGLVRGTQTAKAGGITDFGGKVSERPTS